MDAVTTAERMTAEEFMALAPLRPSLRRQLIEGEVVVNSPSWMHNDSQLSIAAALRDWARAGAGRGAANHTIDVKLDERNIYEPDIV